MTTAAATARTHRAARPWTVPEAEGIEPVIVCDFGHVNGGAAQVAIQGARALAERGVRLRFVYAVGPASGLLTHPNIELVHIDVPDMRTVPSPWQAAAAGIWNRHAARALRQVLAERPQPGPVHLHQWTRAFSPSAILAAAESGRPVAITLHDYFLACPQGLYYHYPRARPCTARPLSPTCIASNCDRQSALHKAVRLIRHVGMQRALRGTRRLHLLHVSAFARTLMEPHLDGGAEHHVVHNPCLIEQAPPVRVRDNHAFVFIGRFTADKGCEELARATAAAGQPAIFLGTGPLEAAIRAANPQAEILPWGGRRAVLSVLERARALAFPSRWYETSGLVAYEAMARGVPVIASRMVGAGERITDGTNGLLIDPGDHGALSHAIMRLSEDATAAAMGRATYAAYWRDPLSVARHTDRLLEVYRAACQAP